MFEKIGQHVQVEKSKLFTIIVANFFKISNLSKNETFPFYEYNLSVEFVSA